MPIPILPTFPVEASAQALVAGTNAGTNIAQVRIQAMKAALDALNDSQRIQIAQGQLAEESRQFDASIEQRGELAAQEMMQRESQFGRGLAARQAETNLEIQTRKEMSAQDQAERMALEQMRFGLQKGLMAEEDRLSNLRPQAKLAKEQYEAIQGYKKDIEAGMPPLKAFEKWGGLMNPSAVDDVARLSAVLGRDPALADPEVHKDALKKFNAARADFAAAQGEYKAMADIIAQGGDAAIAVQARGDYAKARSKVLAAHNAAQAWAAPAGQRWDVQDPFAVRMTGAEVQRSFDRMAAAVRPAAKAQRQPRLPAGGGWAQPGYWGLPKESDGSAGSAPTNQVRVIKTWNPKTKNFD